MYKQMNPTTTNRSLRLPASTALTLLNRNVILCGSDRVRELLSSDRGALADTLRGMLKADFGCDVVAIDRIAVKQTYLKGCPCVAKAFIDVVSDYEINGVVSYSTVTHFIAKVINDPNSQLSILHLVGTKHTTASALKVSYYLWDMYTLPDANKRSVRHTIYGERPLAQGKDVEVR